MSGFETSERIPVRVRALLAVLMALAMLIPAASAFADSGAAQPGPAPVGNDVFCIQGTVINFNETLLGAGWGVTATPIDPTGQVLSTTTDEDGAFKFEGLTPGKWQITLALQPGWEMVPPYTDSFTVDLSYGKKHCTEVRFKIRRPVDVIACKIDDNHNPLADWTIRAEPAPGNWFASPIEQTAVISATDDPRDVGGGCTKFRLTEGDWIFKEKAPKGTAYTPVIPTTGKQLVHVTYSDTGDPITIRFKNRLYYKGCIEVTKLDVPPANGQAFGLPGWKIKVYRPDWTIAAQGLTDSQGYIKFNDLPFGPYIVKEEQRVGWDPATATSYTVIVNQPGSGDNAVCQAVTFFNRQNPPGFCITGRKIDTNGKIGIPGWVITATAVYKGDFPNEKIDGFDALTTTTDGTGVYRFDFPPDDYRIPGAAYKVCEEKRDGWLPHTPTCQTVYLPQKPGACVKAWDFENQQVGHWESVVYGSNNTPAGCSSMYAVGVGDTLSDIAASQDVTLSALKAANPWVYDRANFTLYVGDRLCIPK